MSQDLTVPGQLRSYGIAMLSVALALGATLLLLPWLYPTTTPLFLLAVMVSARYGNWQAGLLAALLSALAVSYFFIEPFYSLEILNIGTAIRLSVFLIAAGVISFLDRSRRTALNQANGRLQALQAAMGREQAASAEAETANARLEEDIHKRQHAETALQETQERLSMAQLAAKIGAWDWDVTTGKVFWSPEYYRLYGLDPAIPATYENWLATVVEADRATAERTVGEALQQRQTDLNFEFRICHPTQGIRWLSSISQIFYNADREPERAIGISIDITDRKRAEAAARQADERFRHMADSSPVLIWQTDETGVTFVNRHYLEFFGQSFAGVKGMECSNFLHPEDRDVYLDTYRTAVAQQQRYEVQCRFLRQDSQYRWLQNVGQPQYGLDDIFIGFVSCAVDVTDLKVAEAELQASEERFRNMADNAPMMVWVTDANGYCTYLSRSWYEFTGQTEVTGLGFGWLNATHPDDCEPSKAIFLAANTRQEAFQLEYRLRRQDGIYRTCIDAARPWFGAAGEFRGYIGSVIDIDDRIRAEAALRQSEERYRTLFESIDEGFCVVEMLFDEHEQPIDYRFLEINPIFAAQTGLQQATGKTARQLVPDLEDHWFEIYGQVALTGEPIRFENHSVPMNRWFDVYACRTGQPQERKVAIVFQDISDRKQVEAERERILQREQAAREAAESANRIKDEFLAVISHELRTPLNPILGWAKLLQQGKLDAAEMPQALATIARNAQLQAQLIDDLLDISRILRGKLSLDIRPVDLTMVIAAALETVRLAAEAKSLHLDINLLSTCAPIMGDAGRLQQVVWNLLSNAVKFTPAGGHICVRLAQTEGFAQIQVTDTGKGIHPDFLPHVFEHFRQEDGATTRKFGGLGLGLAIVRQIVELHGARVSANSPGENQGATFTLKIPLAPGANPPPKADPTVMAVDNLQGVRIFVVDDEPDSRDFMVFVLQQAGAIVTSFASGFEILQAIDTSIPDLIISDIGMPEMDGYMLMQQLRAQEQTRPIPAIALTAYAGEFDRQQALRAGFQKHLSKPIDPSELTQAVNTLHTKTAASQRSKGYLDLAEDY